MVANMSDSWRYCKERIFTIVNAQIENSIESGWKPEDIVLIANFDHEFMGVKVINTELNKICLTGSKMFAVKWFYDNGFKDTVWAHDLDAWQNWPFDEPEFKDVGICCYSRPKFNGGSIFWKYSAKDIIDNIVYWINENEQRKEEPTLNRLLKRKYKDRVTVLNNTYNVGCSGFAPRFQRSEKPIRVCHFHPYKKRAWFTHATPVIENEISITIRLERLLRRYYSEFIEG